MTEIWKNPYIAGAPLRGEEMFFGRDDVFDWLRTHLIGQFQDNTIVLYGERRTGKTSLLYHIPRRLDDSTYIPIFIDLQQLSLDSMNSLLWQVATKIWSGLRRTEGVETLKRPVRQEFLEGPEVFFAETFLTRVEEIIGRRKLLILFDEFNRMRMKVKAGDLPADVFDYLRSLMADHRLTLIVSLGSKLEEMETHYSVLFNQAIYHKITFLDEKDARALITQPVAEYYSYQDDAVEFILKVTSGHPFYVQHICHAIFANRTVADVQSVTVDEVNGVLPDVVEATAQNLKFVWDDVGPPEKAILSAMATLINQGGASTSRDALVYLLQDKGICPPDGRLATALQTLRVRDIVRESMPSEYGFSVEPLRLWLSKERRLDLVRQELATLGIVEQWQQITSSLPTATPWWRRPLVTLPAAIVALICGICVVALLRLALGGSDGTEALIEATDGPTSTTTGIATTDTIRRATTIASGVVAFEDDFSSNVNGWFEGPFSDELADEVIQIVGGKYRRSMTSKQGVIERRWIPDYSAKDFWLNVEATIIETSARPGDANVSLTFRESKDGDYYLVQFANDSTYRVDLWQDGQWKTVQGFTAAEAIKLEPGETNTFALLVTGSSFTLYANGQELSTVTDTSLSAAGLIGLAFGLTEADQTLSIDFDNLALKEIPTDKTVIEIEGTATARARAAATAYVAPTATAMARATTIASGIVAFEDDFSSNVNGWFEGPFSDEFADEVIQIVDGKYRRSMTSKQGVIERRWIPDYSAKDFWLSVEATIIETSARPGDADVSLTFRESKDGDYYRAQFANDGTYRVRLWQDGQWKTVQGFTAAEAIKLEPGETNTFALLVTGSSFTLYANGQELSTVTDTSLSAAGLIGLAFGLTEADQTLNVDFDNLVVKEVK